MNIYERLLVLLMFWAMVQGVYLINTLSTINWTQTLMQMQGLN